MRPAYMTAMRSAKWRALARSWVMYRNVSSFCSCSSLSRKRISARLDASIIETGSSATRKSGLSTIARAMLTRWRCPPDSVWGYLSMRSTAGESFTCSSASITSFSRSLPDLGPWMTSGSSTSSPTRMYGLNEENGSWKITWARWRNAISSLPRRSPMSVPSKTIRPPLIGVRCSIARPSVVLPLPDSPTTATVSPLAMSTETSVTAWIGRVLKNDLRTKKSTVRCSTRRIGPSSRLQALIAWPRGHAASSGTTARGEPR
jgi:hypothetical protein